MSHNMYQENILDYYKHPRNKGKIEGADISFTENNPLCGDEITIAIKFENQNAKEIKFEGHGCAISLASASMMSEALEGKSIEEISAFSRHQMLEMIGVELSPARMKCGLLALRALKESVYIIKAKKETLDMAAIHEQLTKEGLIF